MKINIFAILMLLGTAWPVGLQAQQTITTAGGEAAGAGGNTSYTIGQIAFETFSSGSGSEAQGVQQPFEISVITSVEPMASEVQLTIYPNPVSDQLFIRVLKNMLPALQYRMYDVTGVLLAQQEIQSDIVAVQVGDLVPATYFISIYSDSSEVQTFKIIKK